MSGRGPDRQPRSAETRARMAAAKRRDRNPAWKGDEVGYRAAHTRVVVARGKASDLVCRCGEPAEDWANLTGAYNDVNDYEAMCRRDHRAYDRRTA